MTRFAAALVLVLSAGASAPAAVVVIGNYTDGKVAFSISELDAKARQHTLLPNSIITVYITAPSDIIFQTKGNEVKYRLDLYNAYMFLPERNGGIRLEGIEQPGEQLERDERPELNPIPRHPPVKVPVTLLVDDAELRAEKFWQKELRARFDEVADVIEKTSSIRLECVGYATWKSDPMSATTTELLKGFEDAVEVKAGALAIGYSSRKLDVQVDPAFGVSRGLGSRHILLREWVPKSEAERVEVLLHFAAGVLGAVGTPDPGSAMREKLADGYLLRAGSVLRIDPLNALALNLWADERRRDPAVEIATLTPVNRVRLTRLYKALLKANPNDRFARAYLDELDRDVDPKVSPKVKQEAPRRLDIAKRDELVRVILKAVGEKAKANREQGAAKLMGDDLTAAYVQAAAEAAFKHPGPETIPAFLIALGIALDDTGTLADDPTTRDAVHDAESAEERAARLASLGTPTLGGRRDLCRRFFIGCATAALLPHETAEQVAIGRALFDMHRPAGMSWYVLAAELAGHAFARMALSDAELIRKASMKFTCSDYLPPKAGLRNGLSMEKLEELYGDSSDERFRKVMLDIHARIEAMRAYR